MLTCCLTRKDASSPEQTRHGVAADVVQRRVVVVLLPVRGVGVQAVPELRVAFVQLPGQSFIATCQGLAELGGSVAHGCRPAAQLLTTPRSKQVAPPQRNIGLSSL